MSHTCTSFSCYTWSWNPATMLWGSPDGCSGNHMEVNGDPWPPKPQFCPVPSRPTVMWLNHLDLCSSVRHWGFPANTTWNRDKPFPLSPVQITDLWANLWLLLLFKPLTFEVVRYTAIEKWNTSFEESPKSWGRAHWLGMCLAKSNRKPTYTKGNYLLSWQKNWR